MGDVTVEKGCVCGIGIYRGLKGEFPLLFGHSCQCSFHLGWAKGGNDQSLTMSAPFPPCV